MLIKMARWLVRWILDDKLEEFVNKLGLKINFTPSYSPWSNGINERNHYSSDIIVKKVMEEDKKVTLSEAVSMAAWTHNTNQNTRGYSPLQLVTGKSIMLPGLSNGNLATESLYDDEAIRRIMERHHEVLKQYREIEFTKKLERAKTTRSKGYEDIILQEGDIVFYQNKGNKAWCGPEKIFAIQNNSVFIIANGSMKKIPRSNIEFIRRDAIDDDDDPNKKETSPSTENSVRFDTEDEETLDEFGENMDSEAIKELEASQRQRKTRSMTAMERRELERDQTATFWLQMENTECFDDMAIFAVEVPTKEHKKPEVMEAKDKELENLEKYDVFEEIEDTGQEAIGSRWVITKKEKEDGQKCDYKGRLVAKGFQEKSSPQADSPTMRRESLKLFFALAANQDFNLRSIDIRAAFLQAKNLEREIFLKPPPDVKKEGILWKLKKPLYGLNDASRKFWLKIKEVFKNFGLRKVDGDEALYYKQDDDGELIGLLSTHVDDFSLAGTEKFIETATEEIKKHLDVSKIEDGRFRFTGIDIEQIDGRIELSMEEYADSLEDILIREDKSSEPLDRDEMRTLRKYVGKLSWLASNARPDLAIYALNLAKKQKKATLMS